MKTTKEWHVENCIDRLLPKKSSLSSIFNFEPRRHFSKGSISDEVLEECYIYMAFVVETHGDIFLPIFERLHHEREKRKSQKEMLKIARSVSKDNAPHA